MRCRAHARVRRQCVGWGDARADTAARRERECEVVAVFALFTSSAAPPTARLSLRVPTPRHDPTPLSPIHLQWPPTASAPRAASPRRRPRRVAAALVVRKRTASVVLVAQRTTRPLAREQEGESALFRVRAQSACDEALVCAGRAWPVRGGEETAPRMPRPPSRSSTCSSIFSISLHRHRVPEVARPAHPEEPHGRPGDRGQRYEER